MKVIYTITFLICSFMFSNYVSAHSTPHISFDIELVEWDVANSLLPKYSTFTVIDMETGKNFRVQRRAGSHHTDVQPLTSEDTKIMKSIYGGKWSWKRRAILVQTGDFLIPASMHGMPHGAGALQNNFPGHFCIHFQGSKLHKTDEMDYSHKLMVLKAAGLLDEYVANLKATELVRVFVEGLNQHDLSILSLTTSTTKWEKNQKLNIFRKDIETIKIKTITLPHHTNELLVTDAVVEFSMYTKSKGKQKGTILLPLSRSSLIDSWEVLYEDAAFLLE
ncbi:hypothetical protein [Bacillus suaedaesalsae]|uniref:Uncharacterized protein n=1 Tax=Bacillus suaedaesalsae TaxID=2810349 RepID=A0ABS2DGL1_9BACI|nr:hypothetical protein [Bacillus suaedaesalsae]MBM6617598.1 hypothetical protein [Bacillus suaedaesalsae]